MTHTTSAQITHVGAHTHTHTQTTNMTHTHTTYTHDNIKCVANNNLQLTTIGQVSQHIFSCWKSLFSKKNIVSGCNQKQIATLSCNIVGVCPHSNDFEHQSCPLPCFPLPFKPLPLPCLPLPCLVPHQDAYITTTCIYNRLQTPNKWQIILALESSLKWSWLCPPGKSLPWHVSPCISALAWLIISFMPTASPLAMPWMSLTWGAGLTTNNNNYINI